MVGTSERGVSLSFEGLYAIDRLACRYRAAPGVTGVFQGVFPEGAYDGPKLFAWREGDVFHYVFDHAGGDCPAGCTTHDAYELTTTPGGDVTLVATYEGDNSSSVPSWVYRSWYAYSSCYTR